jgi:hypothetical protein
VYVVLRALVLVTAFDSTALWAYEPYMCGTIGRSLLGGGGDLPLAYYYDNAAGPVLMGFLVAPFYALFGASYLSLKLMSCTLGLGTLVLAWMLLRRVFDVRTANIAALLLAVAPATLAKYTLIAAGNHSENLFFTMLAAWAFFEMHARGVPRRWLFASGLFGGWAFTIFIGALTPLGLLAIAHVGLRGLLRSLRDVPLALVGFALGIAPLIWLNLGSGGRGLAFLAAKFGDPDPTAKPDFVGRIGSFFSTHLPAASTYPSFLGIPGRAADIAFLVITVLALAITLPIALRAAVEFARRCLRAPDEGGVDRQRALVFCLWFYLPLTALAFALSNLKMGGYQPPIEAGGYRYFLPHFVFVICLIAIASDALARKAHRIASVALAAAPIALGAFDLSMVDFTFANTNVGAHYEGHRFPQVARALMTPKLALTPEQIVAHAESFEPLLRSRVYFGLGYYTAFKLVFARNAQPVELTTLLAAFPAERRIDVARGIGALFRDPSRQKPESQAADRQRLLAWLQAREPYVEQVAEGLESEWNPIVVTRTQAALDAALGVLAAAPPELATAQARGFGVVCGRLLARDIDSERALITASFERVPQALRDVAFDGLGAGLLDGTESPRVRAPSVAWIPAASVPSVLAGYARREREIYGASTPLVEPKLDPALPSAWREAWAKVAGP